MRRFLGRKRAHEKQTAAVRSILTVRRRFIFYHHSLEMLRQ